MKKLIAIILCAVLCLGMCGCGSEDISATYSEEKEQVEVGSRLVRVFRHAPAVGVSVYIYVDTETRVMYMVGYESGLTVMVDAEGKPLLWEGELK